MRATSLASTGRTIAGGDGRRAGRRVAQCHSPRRRDRARVQRGRLGAVRSRSGTVLPGPRGSPPFAQVRLSTVAVRRRLGRTALRFCGYGVRLGRPKNEDGARRARGGGPCERPAVRVPRRCSRCFSTARGEMKILCPIACSYCSRPSVRSPRALAASRSTGRRPSLCRRAQPRRVGRAPNYLRPRDALPGDLLDVGDPTFEQVTKPLRAVRQQFDGISMSHML